MPLVRPYQSGADQLFAPLYYLTADTIIAVEDLSSETRDAGLTVEMLSGATRDALAAAEMLAGETKDGRWQPESWAALSRDAIAMPESQSSTARDAAVIVESIGAQSRDIRVSQETALSLLRDFAAQCEENNGAAADCSVGAEALLAFSGNLAANLELLAALLADTRLNFEAASSVTFISGDTVIQVEAGSSATRDGIITTELLGDQSRDINISPELISLLSRDAVHQDEVFASAVTDCRAGVDAISGIRAERPISAESFAKILADIRSSLFSSTALLSDARIGSEAQTSLTILSGDTVIQVGALAGTAADEIAALIILLAFRLFSNPRFVSIATPRVVITTATLGPAMPQGNDFDTCDTGEIVNGTFDFTAWLPGVTISSIMSVTCAAYSGSDPSAPSRLIGSPQIGASPSTGADNSAVLQQWGDMVAGVTYRMTAIIMTTDGQTLMLWAHQPCQAPD